MIAAIAALVTAWSIYALVSELGYPRRREAILRVLAASRVPLYGLEIRERLGRSGTVYADLDRIEDEGFLYSWGEPLPGYPRYLRRFYALTPKGHEAAINNQEAP
jgi:DNA-binding PadR family transcriptional regulator